MKKLLSWFKIKLSMIALLVATAFLHLALPAKVLAAPRPYVVFVNGYTDCCAEYMYNVRKLVSRVNADIRYVPWDSFSDGAKDHALGNDSEFLRDGADFINNQLDRDRPLILIGHSFGGDSLLKLASRINRPIQFLAVLDPVNKGGTRAELVGRGVPSNVVYFFNRWQTNAKAASNLFPFDYTRSGVIEGCRAQTCDQAPQNEARNSDGSIIRENCTGEEITCPGYKFWPGGSNGTKNKRLTHGELATDSYIQRRINDVLTAMYNQAVNPQPSAELQSVDGRFRAVDGWATKNGYAAGFPNFQQANYGQGVVYGVKLLRNAESATVSVATLGNPSSSEERFRAVDSWATKNGYAAGFPNFHQGNNGQGVVFGIKLLRNAERRDVPADTLGNPTSIEERFRAVDGWATKNGYAAGFPNFQQANYGQGVVYGVILIRNAERRDVLNTELK